MAEGISGKISSDADVFNALFADYTAPKRIVEIGYNEAGRFLCEREHKSNELTR